MGANASSSTSSPCQQVDAASLWSPLQDPSGFPTLCTTPTEQASAMVKDKKKKVAALTTLRKRLVRKRRTSKSFDNGQVFREFLSEWSHREVAQLVEEFEATAVLKELTIQAELARPIVPKCKQCMNDLYDNKYCSDINLIYRGTVFPVHRAILSIRCPFFRDLLNSAPPWSTQIAVDIDISGVNVEMFNELLRYLYTGELNVAESYDGGLNVLFQLSEQFGIPNPLDQDLKHLLQTRMYGDAAFIFTNSADADGFSKRHQYFSSSCGSFSSMDSNHAGGFSEEEEFICHKAVLSCRSTFFRNVIQRHVKRTPEVREGLRTKIVLDENVIPRRFGKVLLHALYQDKVDFVTLLKSNVAHLQAIASGGAEAAPPARTTALPSNFNINLIEEAMELYSIGKFLEMEGLIQSKYID